MADFDMDFAVENVQEELAARGQKMKGLSTESLRNALKHPKAQAVIGELLQREAASLKVGDVAKDFCLPRLEAARQRETVRLSEHFGQRPVGLIFGSYT